MVKLEKQNFYKMSIFEPNWLWSFGVPSATTSTEHIELMTKFFKIFIAGPIATFVESYSLVAISNVYFLTQQNILVELYSRVTSKPTKSF